MEVLKKSHSLISAQIPVQVSVGFVQLNSCLTHEVKQHQFFNSEILTTTEA